MFDPSQTSSRLLQRFPGLLVFIPLCLAIAVVHTWMPSHPLQWLLQGGLFVLGAGAAHLVFALEKPLGQIATRIGENLASNSLTSGLPASPYASTSLTDTSPLKQGLILFLLPIVGVFLLSSSRSAVGLGFLLGVSWMYFADLLEFLRNRPSGFPNEYFPPAQAGSRSVQTALIWYGIYMALLIIALLVL